MKSSVKLVAATAMLALCSASARADLIISEVVDGTLSGGQPKFVEISNTGGAPVDLSLYKIVHYNNGGLAGGGNIALNAVMLAPGASYVVNYIGSSTTGGYLATYGFAPDQEVTYGGHNGDDAIALELSAGGIVDVFGVIGCDPIMTAGMCGVPPILSACGSTPPIWDYEDGYAYRCGSTANTTFDVTDWVFSGSDALEDCVGGDPAETILLQTLTTPGVKTGCNTPPLTYCTAKVTSNACSPAIGFSGAASATSGSGFFVNGTNFINNKNCLLFYGVTGQAAAPFQGGTLCVKAPIKRTPGTNTLGNPPPNDCSGVPSIDMNLFAVGGLGGTPLAALTVQGTVVNCQWWGRDPGFVAPNNTQLSNGLEYTVGP